VIDLEPKAVDAILLRTLAVLGDGDAITERGRVGKADIPAAIEELKEIRAAIAGPKRPKSTKRYQMFLSSVGNPDYSQWAPVSDPKWVAGTTLKEMRKHAQVYQDKWNLGGGNWTQPDVLEGDKVVGHFSYNGCFWEGTAEESRGKKPDEWKEIKI